MKTRRAVVWMGVAGCSLWLAACGDCTGGDADAAALTDSGRHDAATPVDAAGRDAFQPPTDAAGHDTYQPPTDAAGHDTYQPPTDAAGHDTYQPPTDAAGHDGSSPVDGACPGTGTGSWMQVLSDVDELYPTRVGHTVLYHAGVHWMLPGYGKTDIRASADAVDWPVEGTVGVGFQARESAPGLAYDNALWIIGGANTAVLYNDVWKSLDGDSWTRVKPDDTNGFDRRAGPGVAVHDGKMWVVGGVSAGAGWPPAITNHSDVWNSTDGLTWTRVKDDTGGFPGRNGGCTLAHDNKLWVIGGRISDLSSASYLGDVWTSTDGVAWTQVKSDDTTGFGRRALAGCAVFDSKMWVSGGVGSGSFSDVWWSTDGAIWTQSKPDDDTAFGERYSMAAWSDGSYLYLHGGRVGSAPKNDVWRSPDGATWTKITPDSSRFERRGDLVGLYFNSKLWVTAGSWPTNDVWSSVAGAEWTLEKPHASDSVLPALDAPCGLVHDGKIWIIGGRAADWTNSVYSSPDGVAWTQVKPNDMNYFSARSGMACTVHDSKLWLVGGVTSEPFWNNDVWSSVDGQIWTQVKPTDGNGFSARVGHALAAMNGALWLIGGEANSAVMSDVWTSSNGVTWTQVKANDASSFAGRKEHVALVKDNALWILGGVGNSWTDIYGDVWTSSNGASWTRQQTSDCSTMPERYSMAAFTVGISVFMIGGYATKPYGSTNAWNDVWAFTP